MNLNPIAESDIIRVPIPKYAGERGENDYPCVHGLMYVEITSRTKGSTYIAARICSCSGGRGMRSGGGAVKSILAICIDGGRPVLRPLLSYRMTKEFRESMVKMCKDMGENAKLSIRRARQKGVRRPKLGESVRPTGLSWHQSTRGCLTRSKENRGCAFVSSWH